MKSKTTFNILFVCLLGALLLPLGCDDVLDLAPVGTLNDATFYQKETDFDGAVFGAYSAWTNHYYNQDAGGYTKTFHLPDDDVLARPTNAGDVQIDQFNWLPTEGTFGRSYYSYYKGIFRANVALLQLPDAADFADESLKPRYEGELRFIRAFNYFFLWIGWGNPPLVLEPITNIDELSVPNTEGNIVRDAIIADLEFAQNNLPASWDDNNLGRATEGAAKAMLGKVLLYDGQFAAAAAKFAEITGYSLMPDYGDNFSLDAENNAESILEIQFSHEPFANSWLATDFNLANGDQVGYHASGRARYYGLGTATADNSSIAPLPGRGQARLHGTPGIIDAFEPGDLRREHTIYITGDVVNFDLVDPTYQSSWSWGAGHVAKYMRSNSIAGGRVTGAIQQADVNNERVIRYADVLLMQAEALVRSGDAPAAKPLVDQVRERAGLAPLASDPTMDDIIQERRVELAFEGHRYNDLRRWHNDGVLQIGSIPYFADNGWQPRNLLYPYPQAELDINQPGTLTQNTGY